MSVHTEATDAHASDHDDHDGDHAAEPALPEPASPAWLPLVGGALFLLALLAFLLTRSDEEPQSANADTTATAAAEEAPPGATGTAAQVARPGRTPPSAVQAPGAPVRENPGDVAPRRPSGPSGARPAE